MMLVNKLKCSRWKLYKPRDSKPGELTWWWFLEMGSPGGENRRDYLGTGANSGDEVACRRVASRIVWTVLLISLEPNHATASRRVAYCVNLAIVNQLVRDHWPQHRPTSKCLPCRFEAIVQLLHPTAGSNQVGCGCVHMVETYISWNQH